MESALEHTKEGEEQASSCKDCPNKSQESPLEESLQIRYEETSEQETKEKPKIPFYGPYTRQLEVGKTYLWCSCGHSKNQPWCDGAHQGTSFKPIRFAVEKQQSRHLLCGCKYTRSPPFCDGVHSALPYGGW